MIEVKHLTQKFKSVTALDDINLSIHKGKIIGLIGPNGSGKSTIIRSIMGILKPTDGVVMVDGEATHRKISGKIAYMPDTNLLYLPTIQDNIDYFASLYSDYDLTLVKEIIESLNLPLDTEVKGLSKGQTVIVRFALTVGRNVDYILLDEPLSGLDPVFRESFISRLKHYKETHPECTVIITSHMLNEIEDFLDEVVAIYFAKILAHDTKENILKGNTTLEAWFKDQYIKAGIRF